MVRVKLCAFINYQGLNIPRPVLWLEVEERRTATLRLLRHNKKAKGVEDDIDVRNSFE